MHIRSGLKKKLLAGEVVLGTFVDTDSADLVEILGLGGFDFVILDTEHAPGNPHSLMGQLRAAELRGMDVIIRLTDTGRTTVLRTLDIGPGGVLAPQMNDVETTREFIEATLYPPMGCRGFACTRASAYGFASVPEYIAEANSDLLRIVQCETAEAVENLERIVALPYIDAIFVGPFDLSLSLGVPGDIYNPKMVQAVDRIVGICKKHGKPMGVYVGSPEDAKKRLDQGFTFIACSMDVLIFAAAVKNLVKDIRDIIEK